MGKSDSDYAKDTQTRRSVSGYVLYLEDEPTMHRSATQKTVVLSSCEAELNAAVLNEQDMMYQRNMLDSIGLKVELHMILEMDNKGAADLVNSFSVRGRARQIDIKQCFLRRLKEAKVMAVKWIPGSENEADIFTKNLDGSLFKRYAELLLGEGAISGKGGHIKKGGCLKAYLQYFVFWDVLSRFTFDANLFYIFNLSRAHNIKNRVITTASVALDSIVAFDPCNTSHQHPSSSTSSYHRRSPSRCTLVDCSLVCCLWRRWRCHPSATIVACPL